MSCPVLSYLDLMRINSPLPLTLYFALSHTLFSYSPLFSTILRFFPIIPIVLPPYCTAFITQSRLGQI